MDLCQTGILIPDFNFLLPRCRIDAIEVLQQVVNHGPFPAKVVASFEKSLCSAGKEFRLTTTRVNFECIITYLWF